MFKKISIILLFCLVSTLVFAQAQQKQILSEKDITSFITNYEKIMAAFDDMGDKYDYLFKEIEKEELPVAELMLKIRSIVAPKEIQDVLRKNGLGDNGYEKAMVIVQGIGVINIEEGINNLPPEIANDPATKEEIEQAKDQLKQIKESINSKDLALIINRKAELFDLIKE